MGEGQDARNLARLRTEVGRLQLELDPPALDEARAQPRAGRRRDGVEQRHPGRPGVDAARAWPAWRSSPATSPRAATWSRRSTPTADGHAPLVEAEALTLEGRT